MLRAGSFIGKQSDEDVAVIEVAWSIVSLEVRAVLRERTAVGRNFVKAVRPGVCRLAGESMHARSANRCLQGIIVRGSDAFDLVDESNIRKLRGVRSRTAAQRRLID